MAHRIGQQLGNYRLHRLLGQGSFAEVYLGYHRYLQTPAALKLLRQPLSQRAQQAFLLEAQTIARLLHPHIVRVLDFGVEGEVSFLVLDYAPSGSLRQRYWPGRLVPLEEVVEVVQQVSQALHYAHRAGRIHRDIKPENLLLGRHQQVWLSDFGLALPMLPSSGRAIVRGAGTTVYAAPEQLRGQPVPASDQYALGVVVYEWLSGQTPFVGSSLDLAIQHRLLPPPSLLQRLPTLPRAVEEVLFTALSKDPRQRFPSVADFADALSKASQWVLPSCWDSEARATPLLSTVPSAEFVPPRRKISPRGLESLLPEPQTGLGRPMVSERSVVHAPSLSQPQVLPLRHSQRSPLRRDRVVDGTKQGEAVRKLSLPVAPGAPPLRWTTGDRMVVGLLVLCLLCVGVFSVNLGWVSPLASRAPGSPAQANSATVPPVLTSTLLPRSSIPASPTVTPTASPSPAQPLLRFGVTPSSFVDHCGTHKATLLPHSLLLENTGSTVPVTWQIQINDTNHSSYLWATASPASGSIAAGQQATVLLVLTSKVCQHAKGGITYQAILTYQGAGIRGAIHITDLVVVP